jgi:ferrochelatase
MMAVTSGPPDDARSGAYLVQHKAVSALVSTRVAEQSGTTHSHDLVYCSRSGPPQAQWMEPDVNDHLEGLVAEGVPAVVLVPVGFVSDHMEVIYDLDTEALATAERLGLPARRAATPGTDPRFVAMVRDLLVERAAVERGEDVTRAVAGPTWEGWPLWDRCPVGCCPNPNGDRPALGGEDA